MANYYANWRTNYFRVKSIEAFEKSLEPIPGIQLIGNHDTMRVLLVPADISDGGGFPSAYMSEDSEDWIEFEFSTLVKDHLVDDEVAILVEAGSEKLRYLMGYAIAVNSKGEVRSVGLNDIFNHMEELTNKPDEVTRPEY